MKFSRRRYCCFSVIHVRLLPVIILESEHKILCCPRPENGYAAVRKRASSGDKGNSNSIAVFDEHGQADRLRVRESNYFRHPRLMADKVHQLQKKVEREKIVMALLPEFLLQIVKFDSEGWL